MVSALAWVIAGLALKWICSPNNVNLLKMNKHIRDQIVMELLNSVQRETQTKYNCCVYIYSVHKSKEALDDLQVCGAAVSGFALSNIPRDVAVSSGFR